MNSENAATFVVTFLACGLAIVAAPFVLGWFASRKAKAQTAAAA